LGVEEIVPMPAAAGLACSFPAGIFDEDAAHGLGGGGEEMTTAVPALTLDFAHQSYIRLVDQRRGLERLAGLLLRQPPGGELAQLVVDQGQEGLGGPGVALLDGREDARDIVHRRGPPGSSLPARRGGPSLGSRDCRARWDGWSRLRLTA